MCGVGYDAEELSLKKHNIMALDKTEGRCIGGGGGGRVGGVERAKKKRNGCVVTDTIAAPKRKLFKVIISASLCIVLVIFSSHSFVSDLFYALLFTNLPSTRNYYRICRFKFLHLRCHFIKFDFALLY